MKYMYGCKQPQFLLYICKVGEHFLFISLANLFIILNMIIETWNMWIYYFICIRKAAYKKKFQYSFCISQPQFDPLWYGFRFFCSIVLKLNLPVMLQKSSLCNSVHKTTIASESHIIRLRWNGFNHCIK